MSDLPALANQFEIFPELALQPEEVRARFLTLTNWFARWLSTPADRRKDVITAAAIQLHASRTQLARTFNKVEKTKNFRDFLPRTRSDRGESRSFDQHVLAYMQSAYMRLRSKQRAWEETVDTFAGTEARVGSYRRACTYMRTWEHQSAAAFALASKAKDYYDSFERPILRDKTSLQPLEVISGDHHIFDIIVIWPDGTLVRPWVSAWADVRTNMMLGFTITRTPDSRSIADSLYTVMRRWGLPRNIYVDNGKSYKAHILKGTSMQEQDFGRIGGLPSDTEKLLSTLHCGLYGASHLRHALPYNSRAKVIERLFGKGGFADFVKPLPGYTGRRYDALPDDTRRRIKSRELLTLEEFLVACYHWIDRMNDRPSRGHGMGGASPREIMRWYMQRGWQPTRPPDERILLLLAMRTERRRVHRYGLQISGVRSDPMFYWSEQLTRHIGKTVICKWAESDQIVREFWSPQAEAGTLMRMVPRIVHAFDEQTGSYLAACEPLERRPYLDDPQLAEQLASQRRTRKAVREEIDSIKNIGLYVSFGSSPDAMETATIHESQQLGDGGDEIIVSTSSTVDINREIEERRRRRRQGLISQVPVTADETTDDDEPFIL